MDSPGLPHDNIQAQAIALIFTFPAIATIVVGLRIYSRWLTRTFGADDWAICFAGVLYWAETITSYYVIKYTYIGYHVWDIPVDYPAKLGAKYAYATELLYNPVLAVIKTSILLFLLRLTGQKKSIIWSIWALLALNGVAMAATFLLTTFHCLPIAANWDPASYPDMKCIDFANFVTATACVSIFTDALVLILPTWIVYNLKIHQRQKLMLIGILSFGLVTVISGLVRVILLDHYDRHLPADPTYSLLFCISTIEVGLAFMAACAPLLKPLVVNILPKIFSTRSQTKGNYNPSGFSRSGRTGYALDQMSRRAPEGTNLTFVEAAEDGSAYSYTSIEKNGVMVTTEMDVQWHEHRSKPPLDHGSSTESLVPPMK